MFGVLDPAGGGYLLASGIGNNTVLINHIEIMRMESLLIILQLRCFHFHWITV